MTESTFDAPCKAKDPGLATPERPGLRSGFIPVTGSEPTTPVYNVLVNDTKPIWIFCGQGPHCMRGMSMVINPPANSPNTIQAYQAAAAALPPPAAAAPPASSAAAPAAPQASAASPPPAAAAGEASASASAGIEAPPAPAAASEGGSSGATPVGAEAASSTGEAGPATFTGAASLTRSSSYGLSALLVGVVALL